MPIDTKIFHLIFTPKFAFEEVSLSLSLKIVQNKSNSSQESAAQSPSPID
jgi:hypothetical protein